MNVVYTAIFGPYEDLKEPLVVTPGWRYICFTDQPFESKTWEVERLSRLPHRAYFDSRTPVEWARYYKINCFTRYDKSIWVDGSFTINCDLNDFWEKNFVSPFTVVQHPMRDCVYEEAATCQRNNRGDISDIAKQIGIYGSEGLPFHNGLIQSGILLRENTAEVREFCNLWWEQIKLSTRDQIGFAYAEWKLNKKWPRIKMDYRTDQNFIFKTHFHRRKKII